MDVEDFVKEIYREDIGRGDLFERLIQEDFHVKALIKAKADGVLSGVVYVEQICKTYGIEAKFFRKDGESFKKADGIIELSGSYTKLLKLERCILNLLQHSSGIATLTRNYVELLKDYQVELLDTRKTRPLLRVFEKYSVRNGGGKNHRLGLDDALMLKDTHLKYITNLKDFLQKARKQMPWTSKIEIESEDIAFAKLAMECGADIVMCDNMEIEDIKEVVEFRNSFYPHVLLEASGNITKETLIQYAETGVDAISSGALIHQATWIDMSMKML